MYDLVLIAPSVKDKINCVEVEVGKGGNNIDANKDKSKEHAG